jgi:hypothetical protein
MAIAAGIELAMAGFAIFAKARFDAETSAIAR